MKIKEILNYDMDSKEADILVSDGLHDILCYSFMFENKQNFCLVVNSPSNIVMAEKNFYLIDNIQQYEYTLQGEIINIIGTNQDFNAKLIVKVFDLEIIIDEDFPGDLKISDFINFSVKSIIYK